MSVTVGTGQKRLLELRSTDLVTTGEITSAGDLNVNSNLDFSGGTQKKIILGSQKSYSLPAQGTKMRILTLANHTSCRVYIDSSENSYNQPIVLDIFYNSQSSAKPVIHRVNNYQWHTHSNDIRFTCDTSGHIYAEKVSYSTSRNVNIRKVEEFKGTVTILDGSTTQTGGGSSDVEEGKFGSLSITGNIALGGTVDGIDIATRDAILTSTTTTAGAALPKSGGTMTGALTLSGAPSSNLHAATKAYVDSTVAGADTQDLSISGQTLSLTNGGSVTLPDADTQDLSISGQTLSLTNGGSVTLPTQTSVTGNAGSVTNGVYTTGNQTIGGNKTFTENIVAGPDNIYFTPSDDDVYTPYTTNQWHSAAPFGDTWHDVQAFNRNYTTTQYVSTDGTNFSSETLELGLFAQQDKSVYEVIGNGERAVRWKFYGVAYNVARYFQIASTYYSPAASCTVKIEISSDDSSWTEVHSSSGISFSASSRYYWVDPYIGNGGAQYVRVTIDKGDSGTKLVRLSSIKMLSQRLGDQGKGSEDAYPYTWDKNRNMTVGNDLTVSGGDITLGGTGRIQGIDTVTSGTDAANKTYVDNAVIANTDTQDLSISGRTISLTDGGNVTVPAPTYASVTGKPTTFTPSSHTHTFASLTSKPTTLSGYGITDAATGAQGGRADSAVQPGDSPSFSDLTVTGKLVITGDIDSYNVTNLDVTDKTIKVNVGGAASVADGAGLIVDRGSSADATILWDHSNSRFNISNDVEISNGLIVGDSVVANGVTLTGDQTLPTDFVSAANGGTFGGAVTVTQNAGTLNLVGTDHSYIQWYPDGTSAGRKAYTGFGGSTDNNFSIINEISGANVKINTNGGTIELLDNTVVTGELEATSLDINGAANIDGLLDVNTGAANTVAIFESTDDKAFIRIKDDSTDTHLITKDNKFSIGESSTDYDNFKVDISSGDTTIAGAFIAGGKIAGTELEGTSLDINGNADIAGNLNMSNHTLTANLVESSEFRLDTLGDAITFYGGGQLQHSIMARDASGTAADDLRINSYGAVYVNLDSNNNNTSTADFVIGKHGDATSTISTLFTLSGEDGDATFTGDIVASSNSAVIQTPRISMEADGTLDWGANRDYGTLTWDTNKILIRALSGKAMEFQTNGTTTALTLDTSQNATFAGTVAATNLSGTNTGDETVTDSTSTTSSTTVASATAVKSAYDRGSTGITNAAAAAQTANGALQKSGGTMTGKITLDGAPTSNLHAATKAYVDGAVIANTDTQDLSISGQTLSLTNGGSVTLPDTNTQLTLNNTNTSTSTTEAATANAARVAYNRGSSGITAANTAQTTANAALPKAGGTMSGAIAMGNSSITGANLLEFADPGPGEGLQWNGGNIKLYESPDDLTTNTAGNLQIVYGSTRRLTVNNSGIYVNGTATIGSMVNAGTDTDRFLVSDTNKVVRFRTGAEVRSDIGAGTSSLELGTTSTRALRGDLVTTTSSTSTTQAATANAVRLAYNRGSLGVTNAASAASDASDALSTAQAASSTGTAAQSTANAALPKAGGTMTGNITLGSNRIVGMPIVLGMASGYINQTAAQFATAGVNAVYVGSNNYGWNDARDWATQTVITTAPVLNQNDQHCGIICPFNLSQVTIHSQIRMNAANGTMQVKVYKMNRATGVATTNLTLTEVASNTNVSTMNGRYTTMDAVGTTAVSAGDILVVGFGKQDSGSGQKPRFNFTLTGTLS